jgi:hypothetical protein
MFDVISSRKSPKQETCHLKAPGSERVTSFFEIPSDWQDQRKVLTSTLKTGSRKPRLISVLKAENILKKKY